jgi:hypothetical protein
MNEDRFQHDLHLVLHGIAGEAAPASLRYRLADVTERAPLGHRQWFPAPLRFATAIVALVVVASLAFLLVPGGTLGPAATGSPTPSVPPSATPSGQPSPTASPSVSPAPSTSPTPGSVSWSSLTWSQGVVLANGQFVEDLVPWGDGYVGVGGVDTGSGLDTAFFTSADGIHWTLVKRLPSTHSEMVAGVAAGHLVRIGNRLLAVGEAFMNAPGQPPDFPPPLWESDDGTTWTQAESPTWDAASTWPTWLLSGPHGVVAVRAGTKDAVVLHSLDGSTWTRATLPATEHAIARDAIAYSSGFVIVGRDGQPDSVSEVSDPSISPFGVGRPAAWISADGVQWSQATVEGNEIAGAALGHVLAVRTGLIALGVDSTTDHDGTMTSWTSVDGRTWSIAGDAALPFAGTSYPVYAADGDRAVVLGEAPEGSGPAAWMTSDGLAWARLAFARSPAQVDCGESSCLRLQQAWLVPDGVIVMGTPGPVVPETWWFATGS